MGESSWIRKMFEEGIELKQRYGVTNVYDFSLGNPVLEPPKKFFDSLKSLTNENTAGIHSYMQNAGFLSTRKKIASKITNESSSQLDENDVMMTCGAAGALNVILHSIIDPNDEVVVFKPFFPEYKFYIDNHGGHPVFCDFSTNFYPSLVSLRKIINKKTKALIINSPNNPTGVTYPPTLLKEISELVAEKEAQLGIEIYIISDEPYRYLEYDGVEQPFIFDIYKRGIVVSSFSKDLSLAGERVGFIATNPKIPNKRKLIDALNFSNRTLGFVNAPALGQRLIENSLDALVDLEKYKKKRDLLFSNLVKFGYEIIKPSGAFYLFPKSPIDDIEFTKILKTEKILVVPGSGFGAPGYFRISYSVQDEVIENALSGFKKALNFVKSSR